MNKNEREVQKLHEQIANLETALVTKESELLQEKQVKEDLMHQSFAVAQSQDSERKLTLLNKKKTKKLSQFALFRKSKGREIQQTQRSIRKIAGRSHKFTEAGEFSIAYFLKMYFYTSTHRKQTSKRN